MRRFLFLLWISAFVLAEPAASHHRNAFASFSINAFADEIGVNECPTESVYLLVKTPEQPPWVPKDAKLLVAVLIQEPFNERVLPSYLPRRSDGWVYVSSEKARVAAGVSVANCFPKDDYLIRLEYYKRLPAVGDWLVALHQYSVSLGADSDQPVFASWRKPGLNDYLRMYWPLFTAYVILSLLFFMALAALIMQIRRMR